MNWIIRFCYIQQCQQCSQNIYIPFDENYKQIFLICCPNCGQKYQVKFSGDAKQANNYKNLLLDLGHKLKQLDIKKETIVWQSIFQIELMAVE